MTKIWVLSDLHYELMSPKVSEDLPVPEAVDLMIVAGDYHNATQAVDHARKQFPYIPLVMILGNHEHYKTGLSVAQDIEWMHADVRADRKVNNRITHILENETVELEFQSGKIRIIGATLWTDFALLHNFAGHSAYAASAMNDFVYIHGNAENDLELRPSETVAWYRESRAYIEQELRKPFLGKTIVVTHHLPSMRSVAQRYRANPLTPAFASACDDLLDLGADLWIHGHTHDSADYTAGKTRVVCNPRGYSDWRGSGINVENEQFNPALVIEI
jgi:predicted phosphodiesterase